MCYASNMKKIFIILAVLFAITFVFWGVYNFVFHKDSVAQKTQDAQKQAQKTAEFLTEKKAQGKVYALVEEGVLGAIYDKKKDKIIYWTKKDGLAWEMEMDGKNKKQLSNQKIANLHTVNWNNEKNKAILTTEGNGEKKFLVYDFDNNTTEEIKKNADLIVWDNSGTKIVYKYFDVKTGKRSLNIAEQNGSNWKELVKDEPFKKLNIKAVPQTSMIAFWNMPVANEESKLQIVSAVSGETKTVLSGKFGADYLWSPEGDKALVSSLSQDKKRITLGSVDLNGKYVDLSVPTFVQKCVWSQDKKTVYLALPGGMPENANLPDDYTANKFNTKDTFWKLDVTTGTKERFLEIADLKEGYDATELFLSASEDALFFVNKTNGFLYRIDF